MRVLGIDPAIRNTGFALIEGDFRDARALHYGTLSLGPKVPQSSCLRQIHEHVCELIERWQPDELAVEGIIYVQSHSTAITMGAARAASILAAAKHERAIFEYPPSSVKLATVGKGQAQKAQVAFMMRALLQLSETPAADAADALAIAYTHLVAQDSLRAALFSKRKEL